MAKQFAALDSRHRDFIARQRIFFTASAAPIGRVNVSPRGTDLFRVIDANAVAYLDRTGSGAETAAHLRLADRLTIMFCAFEGPPLILRLYGAGRTFPYGSREYDEHRDDHFPGAEPVGARQIVRLDLDLVQTSCGFGVPLFDYVEDRTQLDRWAEAKGAEGVAAYRREKNRFSLDGFPTGVAAEEEAT